jgi:hypothetical protein
MSVDKIQRRVRPEVTPRMKWIHLAQAIQEAYNDFKRDNNEKSRQVTLFYYKFRKYEITGPTSF